MTNVSNACDALTHMNVYSITNTNGYWEGNGRYARCWWWQWV